MSPIESAIKEKATASRKKYLHTHPWAKHRSWAQSRAKKRGWKFNLSTKEAHMLWYRDHANKLVRPSLDRKNPKFGYSLSNCRFIEESLNKSLGALAQTGHKTEAQIAASSKNLREWRHKNPPANKGKHKQMVCSIEGCKRPFRCGTMCMKHYQQYWFQSKKLCLQ